MTEINKNIEVIRGRVNTALVQCSRPADSVEILAVSKKCSEQAILSAYQCGLTSFAESYLQEAERKMAQLAGQCEQIQWHFIGPVQSNKTRGIAEKFDWVHSVDRLKIAQRLNEQRPASLGPLNVCLQVNVSGESSKSGMAPESLETLIDTLDELENLKIRGLMAIPARSRDFTQQRRPYRQIYELLHQLVSQGHKLDVLCMGMSDDFEAAICEGATHIRIGRGIFGERT